MKKIFFWLISSLFGIYLFGVLIFSNCFAPWQKVHVGFSMLKPVSVGFLTRESAFVKAVQSVEQTCISLTGRDDYTEYVSYHSLGITVPEDFQILDTCYLGWKWPLFWLDSFKDVHWSLSYTEDSVKKGVNSLNCIISPYMIKPHDTQVVLQEDDTFTIIPASDGNQVNSQKLTQAILDSLENEDNYVDMEKMHCYEIKPAIKQTDIPFTGDVSDMKKEVFTLDMGAGVIEEIPSVILQNGFFQKNGIWYLRSSVWNSYIESLASKYNTSDILMIMGGDNQEHEILSGTQDTYHGWQMDVNATFIKLCEMFLNQDSQMSVLWTSKGRSHEKNHIGNTFVEISLDNQMLYLHEHGDVTMKVPVITGLPTKDRVTPKGMFRTLDFYEDYTMYGSYGSVTCDKFIRLTPNGIGIHDAKWQPAFGDTLYQTVGSHGCINVSEKVMPELYERISYYLPQSVPVVIY